MTTFSFANRSLCQARAGIYSIRGLHNGYNLVGQTSRSMAIRWEEHAASLVKGTHDNQYLQHSFNKHGDVAFAFVLLEEITDLNLLDEREMFWIEKLQSMKTQKGWNMREGGTHGCYGPELRSRVSAGIRGSAKALASRHARRKPLTLISPQGEKITFEGQRPFCMQHDVKESEIYRLLKGQVAHIRGWTLPEPIHHVKYVAKPLTSHLERNCPTCGDIISYRDIWSKEDADSKKTECRSCSSRRRMNARYKERKDGYSD